MSSEHAEKNRKAFNDIVSGGTPAGWAEDNNRNNKAIAETVLKNFEFDPEKTMMLDYACGTGES